MKYKFLIMTVVLLSGLVMTATVEAEEGAGSTGGNANQPPLNTGGNFNPSQPSPMPPLGPNNNQFMPPFQPGDMDRKFPNKFGDDKKFNMPGGQDGTNNMMGNNNDEERAQKEQERMEKQQAQMQAQGLKKMKRGMMQFKNELTRIKKRVVSLTAKGLTAPAALSEAITKADSLVSQVDTAENFDSVQSVMDDIQEVSQTIHEELPKLERLSQLPKVLKQANTQLQKLITAFTRAQTQATKSQIDVSNVVTDFQTKIEALKQTLTQVDSMVKAGQAEEAMDKVQEFFTDMEDAWNEQAKIQAITNLSKYTKQINQSIQAAKRQVKQLARQKLDTTEVASIVLAAEGKFNDLKNLLKVKPIDHEAIMTVLDDLENLKDDFSAKVQDLTGEEDELPGISLKDTPQLNTNFIGKVEGFMAKRPGVK